MDYSLFDVLEIIDFESGRKDYDDITNPQFKSEIWKSSSLMKIWYPLWKLTPKAATIRFLFSRYLGGHINIGDLTIFGCNAMMFIFQLRTYRGYWVFRPPCFNVFWGNFTLGEKYISPNGTPGHPEAKIYYGKSCFR